MPCLGGHEVCYDIEVLHWLRRQGLPKVLAQVRQEQAMRMCAVDALPDHFAGQAGGQAKLNHGS